MKALFLLLFLAIPALADDWTVGAKTYHNVVVGKIEADVVHITYDGGLGTVKIADLPAETQKRLGYDPDKADVQAKMRSYEAQISDLRSENASLRAALSRYKGALNDAQAAPATSVAAFHCYLFATAIGSINWVGPSGRNPESGLIAGDGPYKGLNKAQVTAVVSKKWMELSDDEKMKYEKMAEATGDPIAKADAEEAAKPTSYIINDNGYGNAIVTPVK